MMVVQGETMKKKKKRVRNKKSGERKVGVANNVADPDIPSVSQEKKMQSKEDRNPTETCATSTCQPKPMKRRRKSVATAHTTDSIISGKDASKENSDTMHHSDASKDSKRVKKKGKRKATAGGSSASKKAPCEMESTANIDVVASCPVYAFDVNPADHCETPLDAYRDLVPVLDRIAQGLGKTRESLKIYDPYYCEGGIKNHLRSLGFAKISNRNQDCYEHWDTKTYDVLVTNPPYSGDHVVRLMRYIASRSRQTPFCLLLPNYFYTKPEVLQALGRPLDSLRFLVPPGRYIYDPPRSSADATGSARTVGKNNAKTAPFVSLWFLINPPASSGVQSWALPDRFKPSEDKTRRKKPTQTGPRYSKKGELLCEVCGQVSGKCRHTRKEI